MLIRTFVEMGSLVQAKKISEGIYPMIHVYGRGDHFGHVTQMPGIIPCSSAHKIWLDLPCGFGGESL